MRSEPAEGRARIRASREMANSPLTQPPWIDGPGTIADPVAVNSEQIHQSEVEIGERQIRESDMPTALHGADASAGQYDRNVKRRMRVAVRKSRAVTHRDVDEQRSFAVGCRFQ